ncbi:ABC transporter permease [Nakamurella lactea]|uniref:ABC transporter permease n=1 Tax=Nakamurella lactea TaxID=459515 RepID=UPI0003F7CB6A|nr:ABC transporter permease [Nakamurella lactea]
MTMTTDPEPLARPVKKKARTLGPLAWVGLAALGLLLFATVRQLTGATNLTSSGAIQAAIGAAAPIALAGLSGLWSERSGVVNIGIEGMMVLGTFGAGWAGYQWGPWAGIFFALVCGALGGLLHAMATVTFGVDHIISGVAINIIAPGFTLYLAKLLFTNAPGGGQKQSPPVSDVYRITIPGLSNWLGTIEDKQIFFVSDLAGILRGATTHLSVFTVLAVLLIVLSGWVLWRTRFGLRVRSCGEAPYAAESLGVNVIKYKFAAVTISGATAGLAGAFLVVGLKFQDGQTGGRGYIGLAAMIFGNWRPGGMAMGAALFGYTDGMQLYDTGGAIHALLLILAVALVVVAILQMRRGHYTIGAVSLVIAALSAIWFFSTDDLPGQLVTAAPYAITLLVMGLASQNLRMPKADGLIYRKGEH